MRTAPFETSCAKCHGDRFNGQSEPSRFGIVLLQIPALDLDTLASMKVDVGHWPRYDASPPVRISPLLRLLLPSTDAHYLDQLPPDLGSLRDATDAQIQAVQQLAWAIKELLGQVVTLPETDNLHAWQNRLDRALGRSLAPKNSTI